jgi:hypothetical protein
MRWIWLSPWLAAATLLACTADSAVSRRIGARCEDKSECDDRCLSGATFPGGFCSVTCDRTSDCPEGSVCIGIEGGVCLFNCPSGTEDCRFLGEGWTCQLLPLRDQNEEAEACAGP